MNLLKGILSGSAAGLCCICGANAADLPNQKSAPVEYVRVCSQYGQGFFYVPGTDSCIQIGGRLRADTMYIQTNDRNTDSAVFSAQVRLNLDVRTNTAYGTLRSYLRYNLLRSDSNYGDGFNNGTTGVANSGGLDQAFIQFAGLTAGRIQSFFDFYADNYNYATIRSSDTYTQVLAYSFTFGQGWTLTASIEDGNERRVYDNTAFPTPYGLGQINGVNSAGQTVPDGVVALTVDQGWGTAQLAAAIHQVRPAYFSYSGANASGYDFAHDTEYGFALHGGVKFNLPKLAPGDELWIEGAYADGAVGYLGALNYGLGQGNIVLPVTDAFVDGNGRLKRTRGWSVMVDLMHYWTPSVRQNIFASYMQLNYGKDGYVSYGVPGYGTVNVGFVDANELRVGSNLIWSPIKNFDIGVEVLYTRVDPKGRVISSQPVNGAYRAVSSDDGWQGRLRLERDF